MGEYYKVDTRKLSLRELWNIRPTWKILIPWIAARFGISLTPANGFKIPDSVAEIEVAESEFPPQAIASLQPALDEALKYGFSSPRYYCFESLRRDTRTSFISLLHRSGEFSLRLMHTMSTKISPPHENRVTVLLSELNDGNYFVTSDSKPKFRPIPGVVVNRVIGAPVSQLLESHEKHLSEIRWQNPAKPVRTLESLDDTWNRYEKFSNNFSIQRGLYVKMSPEEVAFEQGIVADASTGAAVSSEHFDVMVELNQLQNKKAGLGGVIWILTDPLPSLRTAPIALKPFSCSQL